jgi:hypothetical protein
MLHPTYRGAHLTGKQLGIVNEWIISQDSSFITVMINYQERASPFPSTYFTDAATKISPVNWWKALKLYGLPSDFVALAVKLLSCPASSASIERIFSNFGNIHTKVRNRLGNSTAFKLVFCYRMLRGTVELEY